MTREDAINIMKVIVHMLEEKYDTERVEDAVNMAIKSLEQEPILDKIRAEIDEQYDKVYPYNISCAEGLEMALGIIDKYKSESELKEE